MLIKKTKPVPKHQDGNIIVGCRFRPLNELEQNVPGSLKIDFLEDTKSVVINHESAESKEPKEQCFTYDYVFPPSSEQKTVYECIALPIVEGVMQGFNGAVLAYGQTASGKTFTMAGPDIHDESLRGIVPRMVHTIFHDISKADADLEITVRISYFEIYLEKVYDLIDTKKKDLKVLEDKVRGVFIPGISTYCVNSAEELLMYMKLGQANRKVASTAMNPCSSRSHAIFFTTISQKNTKNLSSEKTGKMLMVDLIGSESVEKIGSNAISETKNINKSLTYLGIVINSLADGGLKHIPYRNSLLTRVLKESLGGNSRTALIVTCSLSPNNFPETTSTLRFGSRAKAVKNTPQVNKEFTVTALKLLIVKLEEQVREKNKIIDSIEEKLRKSGFAAAIIEEEKAKTKHKEEEGEEEEEEVRVKEEEEEEESEVMKNLRETKEDLLREYEKSEGIKEELLREYEKSEGLHAENLDLRNTNENLVETIKNLKDNIEEMEKKMQKISEVLENTVEMSNALENQINNFSAEKIDLEDKIRDLSYKLDNKHSQIPEISNLEQTDKELRKYKDFEKKIFAAEDLLKSKLSSSEDSTGLREIIMNSLFQEKKAIDENYIASFLEDYYEEIERLNSQVASYEKKYNDTVLLLSYDNKKAQLDLGYQTQQIQSLTFVYNKLLNKRVRSQVEQYLSKKKTDKLIETNNEQSLVIRNLNDKLEELNMELSAKALEVVENISNEIVSERIGYSNLRKPIKGGRNFLSMIAMADNKNIKFFSDLIKAQANNG